MAETKTATYKRYNGKDWDTIYFATSASQVGESSARFFIKPGSNTVNGKQFTENGGITLYSTDIKLSSSDTTTVKDAIAQAMSAIPTGVLTTANYATTLDSVYEKKSDATSAHNTLTNKIDNLTTSVNNRYTKTESDNKYQPKGTYATLGTDGKVPSSQLPSYVDDVIEGYYSNGKFYSDSAKTQEITGEGGKIYTDLTSNKTYRWGGTAWVEISASLAIGTTAGTAYDGASGAKNASDIATNTTDISNLKSGKQDKLTFDSAVKIGSTNPVTSNGIAVSIQNSVANKANKATTLAGYGITDAYTKTESDGKYQPKGNYASATHTHTFDSLTSKPTTLSGYGITDAYTKTEADGKYQPKGNYVPTNDGSIVISTEDDVFDVTIINKESNNDIISEISVGKDSVGMYYGNNGIELSQDRGEPMVMIDGAWHHIAYDYDISNRATKIYFEDTVPTSGMVAGDICIEY